MSDSEYEETLIFADFKNELMPQELGDPKTVIKIIGLETETPMAEINGNIFKGNFDYAMGTNVFFEKDENPPARDPLYEPNCKQMYKYFAKTNKVINFQRMFVESNADNLKDASVKIDPDQQPSTSAVAAAVATEMQEEEVKNQAGIGGIKPDVSYEEAIKMFADVPEARWRQNQNSS